MKTEFKATYIRSTRSRYDKKYYTQHWSYRGHEYMIEMPADGNPSTDYTYGEMRPFRQHQRAQAEIDEMIDNPKTEEPRQAKYEDTAQAGFDLFWSFVEQ